MLRETQICGFSTSRLAQICQSNYIERTMHLLFALNHWAKARDRLFYADRQGLYTVKGAILRQAFTSGSLSALCYIDGIEGFGTDLAFDTAAEIATEGFLWKIEELVTPPFFQADDLYDRIARQLYTKITGQETVSADGVERLDAPQVREYILAQLQELERTARTTRQPVPCSKLQELCIAPSDLLYIQDRRYYGLGSWDSWDQLDESDLRKLDPEGLSLVAFHHISPNTCYTFHLPLRTAETFVSARLLEQLKGAPWTSRESGEYYGRSVTEVESLQQPIADILRELEVNVPAICPRLLSDKQAYLLAQARRYEMWSEEEDDDDYDEQNDEFWRDVCVPMRGRMAQHSKRQEEPNACPLCAAPIADNQASLRIEHWQVEHTGQDLTFCQANWLIQRTSDKQKFYQQYPPDYRAPHEKGQGTRYWRLETLAQLAKVTTVQEQRI